MIWSRIKSKGYRLGWGQNVEDFECHAKESELYIMGHELYIMTHEQRTKRSKQNFRKIHLAAVNRMNWNGVAERQGD